MTTPPPDDVTLLRTLATAEGWMVTPSERGFKVRYREECGTLTFTDTDGAWRFVFKMCPAYLTSVDAALALPWPWEVDESGTYYTMEIKRFPDGEYSVTLFRHETDAAWRKREEKPFSQDGYELARALCEVFAAWFTVQEATRAQQP